MNTDTMQISKLVANLPTLETTLALQLTPKQKEIWHELNAGNALIARCFEAVSFGYNDPLAELAIGDKEDRMIHNFIWSETFVLRSLWQLVQQAFIYLKQDAEARKIELPGGTAFSFFAQVLSFEENLTFARHCQQFYEVNLPKCVKEAKIRKKDPAYRTEKERATLKKLHSEMPDNPYLLWLEAVTEKNKRQNQQLRKAARNFYQSISDLHLRKEEILAANNRGLLRQKLYSYALLDGQEVRRKAS